jgi:multidrug efflux system membrane fusion protein
MKRIFISVFCVLPFLFSGCAKKEELTPEKVQTVSGVKIETVKSSSQEEIYEAVGTIRSKTTSVISTRVMGNVLAIHVHEGERVKTGQLLIEIDDRESAAQLRKARAGVREAEDMLQEMEKNIKAAEAAKSAAEANKNLAEATFHRYKGLLERKSVSQQEFDEIQAKHQASLAEVNRAQETIQSLFARKDQVLARIEQAKAEVTSAQLTGGYARISSPLNGIVTAKQAEVGTMATPGLPLLTIEDDTRYRLEAMVMESQMGKIRVGKLVQIVIGALDKKIISGMVAEIAPVADPTTRTATVKIDLVSPAKEGGETPSLRSGMFGKALFPVGQRTLITVPVRALIERGQLLGVYAVDSGNIARLKLIQTGKAYGDQVEVLSGLREGEKIIGEGVEKVKEGNQVKE